MSFKYYKHLRSTCFLMIPMMWALTVRWDKSNHKASTSKYPTLCHNLSIFINLLLWNRHGQCKVRGGGKQTLNWITYIYIYIYIYILLCSTSSQISILICYKCIKSKGFYTDVPNQVCWKPHQVTACDMTQEKKKGNAEKVSSALILYIPLW